MTPEEMASVAVATAVKELTTATTKGAVASGRKVWGWLKGNASEEQSTALAKLAAEPGKKSAELAAEAVVLEILEEKSNLSAELARVLEEAKSANVAQQSMEVGEGGTGVQNTGNNNSVNVTR